MICVYVCMGIVLVAFLLLWAAMDAEVDELRRKDEDRHG